MIYQIGTKIEIKKISAANKVLSWNFIEQIFPARETLR